MKVDMHIHSNCSDGELSPATLVERENAAGLDVIAITDHDNANGAGQAVAATRGKKIKVVAGIELSAYKDDTETHVLAYGIDYDSDAFKASMFRIQEMREARNLKIIDRLYQLGIKIDYDALKNTYKGEILGRSHIARQLVAAGICDSVPRAFDEYLAPNGKAFVSSQRLTPEKAIQLACRYGGVPVLAHPAKLRLNSVKAEAYVRYLAGLGLKGIEAAYFSHTNVERDFYLYLAKKYDLYVFGGSDFHSESYGVSLGSFFEPDERTQNLIASMAVNV